MYFPVAGLTTRKQNTGEIILQTCILLFLFFRFHQLLDTNTVPYFLFCSSNRWLAVRLDIISVTVITVTGLLVIVNYESMTPAMAGMALAFAIQVCLTAILCHRKLLKIQNYQ